MDGARQLRSNAIKQFRCRHNTSFARGPNSNRTPTDHSDVNSLLTLCKTFGDVLKEAWMKCSIFVCDKGRGLETTKNRGWKSLGLKKF